MVAAEFSSAQKKALTALLRCVAVLTGLNPNMPIGEALAFLQVAVEPGKGPQDYSALIGMPTSTVSRWLIDLGTPERGATETKVLQVRLDPSNLRQKQYHLNSKGQAVINRCLASLEKIAA